MAMIEITGVSGSYLYHRYPGQTEAQGCHVELDCESGELTADYDTEIGNAVPMRVWHGHTQRWGIPALRGEACNELLEQLAPLAQRVCDGYRSEWDGSNHVARFDADAEAAREEIARLCERADDRDVLCVWDAADWYAAVGSRGQQRAALGITAATTDAELDAIVGREREQAASDGVDEVEGLRGYLTGLRDEAGE